MSPVITFKSVRFKNFLSYGNAWTEFTCNLGGSVNLIYGKNAGGKTSISNSITWCLYGKTSSNIPKAKVVNSINNKECLVEVVFETNGAEYLVRRGLKPAVFEIYKNGELIKQDANIKDYQAYLEESILKCGYKSFNQLVILGVASFTPFLSLSAPARKEIVEQILNIRIFSVMNDLLKEKMQTNATLLTEVQTQLNVIKERLKTEKSLIIALRNQKKAHTEENTAKIQEARAELEKHQEKVEKIIQNQKKIELVLAKYDDFAAKRRDVREKLSAVMTELKRLNKDLKFILSNDVCPFCHQDITKAHQDDIGSRLKETIETLDAQRIDLEAETEKLDKKEKKFQDAMGAMQKLSVLLNTENTSIGYINKEIERLLNEKDATPLIDNVEQHEELARELAKEGKGLLEEKTELVTKRGIMEQSTMLLRDKGIKTKVIEQYLPIINAQINKFLNDMDFYISFSLDETFTETIKSRERDEFAYENLSQGEKRRLDLAILFTWRAIAEIKNSCATNILFADEILENLDGDGAEIAIKLFKSLTGVNVFVISHRADIQDNGFDHVYHIEKKGQFSSIEET